MSKLLGSSTKTPMLLPEYYDNWADRLKNYLIGIEEDFWRLIMDGPYHASVIEGVGTVAQNESMDATWLKNEDNVKRCITKLRSTIFVVVKLHKRSRIHWKKSFKEMKEQRRVL